MTTHRNSLPALERRVRQTARVFAIAASVALGTGCMMPPVAPLGAEVDAATLARDEQHLWKRASEMSHRLDRSGLRYEDPALDAYLTGVANRLAGEELAAAGIEPRVRVLSNPDMNAFAFPNGVVYIHTALLARMDNEAQLATTLSREYAHVIQRHGLLKHRSDRATGNLLAASGLALSGMQGGGNAKMLLDISSATSMAGYGHALEKSADRRGLEMMERLGYDLEQAPKLFEITVAYLEEVSRQRPVQMPFAMSTPVHVNDRIAAYRKLIDTEYGASATGTARVRNTDEFRRRVDGATVHQARLELDRGRFESAAITIDRSLDLNPRNPDAWVVLGEARERSKDSPDLPGAVEAYERALAAKPGHAPAHRALGMVYYRDGRQGRSLGDRRSAARRHLRRYIEIEPNARDAEYVRTYLAELGEESVESTADSGAGGAQ